MDNLKVDNSIPVREHLLLATAVTDIPDTESDDELHFVCLPPENDDQTDTEAIDDNRLDNDDLNLDLQQEIACRIEVHDIRGSHETNTQPSSSAEKLTSQEISELAKETLRNSDISKDDKINQLVKLQKLIGSNMVHSWERDDNANIQPPWELPNVNIDHLTDFQKSSKQKVMDHFSGVNPVEAFEFYFDDEMRNHIITESNRYAHEIHNTPQFNLTDQNLKSFIGILLLTGYHSLPQMDMYWSSIADRNTDIVRNAMSRNEFRTIKRYLHLADNKNLDKADKNAKIRPLFDITNKKLKQFGNFHTHLSIDEMMTPYTGRSSSKQTIRTKSVRFGFKTFVLASHDGYPIHLSPYSGSRGIGGQSGENLTIRSVLDVFLELPEYDNVALFFDNWFSSTQTIALFGSMGIPCTATVRFDRTCNAPVKSKSAMMSSKIQRGNISGASNNSYGTNVVRWKDNAIATLSSNFEGVNPIGKAKRYNRKTQKHEHIDRPNLISSYNAYMGGVDRCDSQIAVYRIKVKSKKWWFNHFTNTLRILVAAAYYMYKVGNPDSTISMLNFTSDLVLAYIGSNPRISRVYHRSRDGNFRVPDAIRLHGRGHWPIPSTPKRCAVSNCQRRVRIMCKICEVALCIDENNHWELFHS